jgi:hypothetical protein
MHLHCLASKQKTFTLVSEMLFLTKLPLMQMMTRAPSRTGYAIARFNAVSAVLSISEAFCNVTPLRLMTSSRRFERSISSLKAVLWPPDLKKLLKLPDPEV